MVIEFDKNLLTTEELRRYLNQWLFRNHKESFNEIFSNVDESWDDCTRLTYIYNQTIRRFSLGDDEDIEKFKESKLFPFVIDNVDEQQRYVEFIETLTKMCDIHLVMQQAGVPGGKALQALNDHQGDLVEAIMFLTL